MVLNGGRKQPGQLQMGFAGPLLPHNSSLVRERVALRELPLLLDGQPHQCSCGAAKFEGLLPVIGLKTASPEDLSLVYSCLFSMLAWQIATAPVFLILAARFLDSGHQLIAEDPMLQAPPEINCRGEEYKDI